MPEPLVCNTYQLLPGEACPFPVNWKPKLIKLKTTNNLTNQGL
jgi:hypothetical protein